MRRTLLLKAGLILAGLVVLGFVVYQIPPVNNRLSWRVDFAMTYVRAALNPVGELPTALPQPAVEVTLLPTSSPTPGDPEETPTPGPTATPTLTPTAIPDAMAPTPPEWRSEERRVGEEGRCGWA